MSRLLPGFEFSDPNGPPRGKFPFMCGSAKRPDRTLSRSREFGKETSHRYLRVWRHPWGIYLRLPFVRIACGPQMGSVFSVDIYTRP